VLLVGGIEPLEGVVVVSQLGVSFGNSIGRESVGLGESQLSIARIKALNYGKGTPSLLRKADLAHQFGVARIGAQGAEGHVHRRYGRRRAHDGVLL